MTSTEHDARVRDIARWAQTFSIERSRELHRTTEGDRDWCEARTFDDWIREKEAEARARLDEHERARRRAIESMD